MSRTLTSINTASDSFQTWIDKYNIASNTFTTTVTVASNTAGDLTTGNCVINGLFNVNTLIGRDALRGGNVTTSNTLTITSNVTLTGVQSNSTANIFTVAANVEIWSNSTIMAYKVAGNSTATNTFIGGTTLTINTASISVNGSITVGNTTLESSNSVTTTGTTAQLIDSFVATTYRGAKYISSITNNVANGYHIAEILLTHDGTTTFMTEYAAIFSNTSLGVFSSNIAGGVTRMYLTPTPANTTVKTHKTLLVI